ncbi:MAG: dTMP kinase [Elusimicrobiaceae bacterium]|nr:dTMP kinase [Elusimicrobiaceae bacterium]
MYTKPSYTGKFIVFEGPDRCGKSTQANLLEQYFIALGKDVILTREPGGDKVAEDIREIVLNPDNVVSPMTELLLYEASRAQHTEQKVLPALKEGKIVICERYTMSTCAYQGYGRNIDMGIIDRLNNIATLGLEPDLTLVFLMSDKYFKERGEHLFSDRLEREDEAFRHKMRQGYKELVAKQKNAVIINADNDKKTVQDAVIKEIKNFNII